MGLCGPCWAQVCCSPSWWVAMGCPGSTPSGDGPFVGPCATCSILYPTSLPPLVLMHCCPEGRKGRAAREHGVRYARVGGSVRLPFLLRNSSTEDNALPLPECLRAFLPVRSWVTLAKWHLAGGWRGRSQPLPRGRPPGPPW